MILALRMPHKIETHVSPNNKWNVVIADCEIVFKYHNQ